MHADKKRILKSDWGIIIFVWKHANKVQNDVWCIYQDDNYLLPTVSWIALNSFKIDSCFNWVSWLNIWSGVNQSATLPRF